MYGSLNTNISNYCLVYIISYIICFRLPLNKDGVYGTRLFSVKTKRIIYSNILEKITLEHEAVKINILLQIILLKIKHIKMSNYSNIIFTDKASFNGKSWLIISLM